ncbi:MAG TPA: AI-2E family transporter [Candidatus Eremiobacteraceae bacterium]|nr:AI-2E family transporter [Candidatus Eremiobacteraceae bacterium]
MTARTAGSDVLDKPRALRIAGALVLTVVSLYVLSRIPLTVEVFIVATLMAYGINPIVRRLSRRVPRAAAVALVYAALVLIVLFFGFIIVPDTIAQLQSFFANSGDVVGIVQGWVNSWQAWIVAHFGAKALPAQFQDIENSALAQISKGVNNLVLGAGNALLGIASDIVVGITAIVLSYYFLTRVDDIRNSFYSLFPESGRSKAERVAHEISRVVGGFVYGQFVLCVFTGLATWLVLAIAGSQYALLLGALTGVLYALPFLGILFALAIGVMLGSLQGWTMALITVVTIAVISKISDILLVPKVMGDSVGVSPMAVIFAIFAGGELFGVWGLVLAIPAAALIKLAWNLWIHPWIRGQPPFSEEAA